MISKILLIIGLIGCGSVTAQPVKTPIITEMETKTVVVKSGEEVSLEAGRLTLPENRETNSNRTISIPFYRLRALGPSEGRAVFILAGGPGSSGIQRFSGESSFKAISFYRQFADVVVFDQRGTGGSVPNLKCEGRKPGLSMEEPPNLDQLSEAIARIAGECRDHWLAQGIDLSAYNTDESASDVNDLRAALGYEKIILQGNSYGSHLGLHVIKRFPQHVDRAVFSGIEGPNHTYDHPGHVYNSLERIAAFVEKSGVYSHRLPPGGLMEALKVSVDRLREKPVMVEVKRGDQVYQVPVSHMVVQMVATWKAGSRDNPHRWPELVLDMYEGDYSMAARAAMSLRSLSAPNAMKYMMDHASGISPARRQTIDKDPAAKLLAFLDMDLRATEGAWKARDLGSVFRANVVSNVPVLLIHGTMDTSTPIENAREVLTGLKQGHLIEVVNGNHGGLYNLYASWPPAWDMIRDFMLGSGKPLPQQIRLEDPVFPNQIGAPKQTSDAKPSE